MRAALTRLPILPASLLSLLCTGLLAIGAPPGGTPALIWLAFVPTAWVCRQPHFTPRQAAFVGWFGGLGAGLFGFPWLAELLERFAGFSWPMAVFGLFVFSAWTAVQWGIFGYGLRALPWTGWRGALWGAGLWVTIASLWPALFPYTAVLGLAQAPVWIQLAEFGGTALVEAQILAVGMLLADAIVAPTGKERLRSAGAALAVFTVSTAFGAARISSIEADMAQARKVRFGVVQPNIPLRWPDALGKLDRLRTMSRKAQEAGAQVVLWPEAGVYPVLLGRPFERDFADARRKILAQHDLPTIFGAPSRAAGEDYGYNSVFNMGADGVVRGSFDKVQLMPFGEYVPIVDPKWAKSKLHTLNHNYRGEGPARFEVRPAAAPDRPDPGPPFFAGPLVCYEDIFPEFARKTAALPGGVDVFVNLTIDTWFGDTAEPWEHLALSQFRAVEHRVPLVRSVAAGPSSIVDATGRLVHNLDAYGPTLDDIPPPEVLVADVALPRNTASEPTVYARGGWLLPRACQLAVLVVVAVAWRRRRRAGAS